MDLFKGNLPSPDGGQRTGFWFSGAIPKRSSPGVEDASVDRGAIITQPLVDEGGGFEPRRLRDVRNVFDPVKIFELLRPWPARFRPPMQPFHAQFTPNFCKIRVG
jgi:hypothetical protein